MNGRGAQRPRSQVEFALKLHSGEVEERRYVKTSDLRDELNALVGQSDFGRTREKVNHPRQVLAEQNDLDTRGFQILLSIAFQKRSLL
jgi:hypothetical protein